MMLKSVGLALLFVALNLKEGSAAYYRDHNGHYWWRPSRQSTFRPRYVSYPQYVAPFVVSATRNLQRQTTTTPTVPTQSAPTITARTTSAPPAETPAPVPSPSSATTVDTGATSTTSRPTTFTNVEVGFVENITGSFIDESSILQRCEQLQPESLRAACERVAKNPILRAMGGARGFIGDEENSGEPFQISRKFSFRRRAVGKQVVCNGPEECPTLSRDDPELHRKLPSLSPWVMCQEYDPNRFPQWLNTAQCQCDGCIDLETLRENGGSVSSVPITVEVSVLRKDVLGKTFRECDMTICREEVQKIAVGCHCALVDFNIN